MKYSAQKLALALYELNQDSKNKNLVANFLDFCETKNLNYLLPNILKHYQKIIAQNEIQKTVFIKSNYPLSKNIVSKVQTIVGAEKNSETNLSESKGLLGGFIAQYQNKIFDASLKNQLEKLKNKLINNS
ncbi:MAG: F0F1 ATP synthase subunit delta [Patescibacteria group bacterium]